MPNTRMRSATVSVALVGITPEPFPQNERRDSAGRHCADLGPRGMLSARTQQMLGVRETGQTHRASADLALDPLHLGGGAQTAQGAHSRIEQPEEKQTEMAAPVLLNRFH
jgi:hypothetical protein